MLLLLFPTLFLFLIISYKLSNNDLIAPVFLFTGSFCFSSIWATLYAKKWSLDLKNSTYFVICGGVLVFIVVCVCTSAIFRMLHRSTRYNVNLTEQNKPMIIEKWKLYFMIVFEIITLFWSVLVIMNYSGEQYISSAIGFMKGGIYDFPTVLSIMRLVTLWSTYWFCYAIADYYVKVKKISIPMSIIIIIGMLSSLITGGRNQLINIIISLVVFLYLLNAKYSQKSVQNNMKVIIRVIILLIIVLFLFRSTLDLLGRITRVQDPMDYIAMYCGAQIKNLNTYLETHVGGHASGIFDSTTFKELTLWIGKYFGKQQVESINYFQFVNGYALGNVYTTFYAFVYDYGYVGVGILSAIMAFCSQEVYERAKRSKMKNVPSLSIILYGYISSSLVLSFFSNKFFEQNFSVLLFRGIIVVLLLNWFMCKVKIRFK